MQQAARYQNRHVTAPIIITLINLLLSDVIKLSYIKFYLILLSYLLSYFAIQCDCKGYIIIHAVM